MVAAGRPKSPGKKTSNEPISRFFSKLLDQLRCLDWVVYAKRPFGGPEQVLAYLGRYTHRVAIANSRLISLADGKVRFTWKDYRAGESKQKGSSPFSRQAHIV